MATYIEEVFVYTDGGCKPNPGTMVGSFLISDGSQVLKGPISQTYGDGTNVVAEFKAIESALDEAVAHTRKKVRVHCDNEFAIKALNKERRIPNAKHLRPIVASIYQKASLFEEVTYAHVSEDNQHIKKCDGECKKAFTKLGFN